MNNIGNPPKFAWYNDIGLKYVVGTKYNWQMAIFLLVFALIWLSFIALFTFLSLKIEVKIGQIIFVLFTIPFWLVGIYLIYLTSKNFFGKIEVHLSKYQVQVRKYFFWYSSNKTFSWSDIKEIELIEEGNTKNKNLVIKFSTEKDYYFGKDYPNENTKYLFDFIIYFKDEIRDKLIL